MTIEEINQIQIPSRLTKKTWKIRTLMYYNHICQDKKKALEYSGIKVYNVYNQFNAVKNDDLVLIFCENIKKAYNPNTLPANDIDINDVSRETLIKLLNNYEEKDKVKSIELIAKLKGYLRESIGELDTARPIYIITNTRKFKMNDTKDVSLLPPPQVCDTTPPIINNDNSKVVEG